MLNKKLRVSKDLFQGTFKKSKILSSPHLLLRVSKENDVFPSKFSFAVPKSVSKKAVTRNLLKRRGYSIIRNNLKIIKKSHICIFSFKKGSSTLSFDEIKEEIIFLLKKSRLIDF